MKYIVYYICCSYCYDFFVSSSSLSVFSPSFCAPHTCECGIGKWMQLLLIKCTIGCVWVFCSNPFFSRKEPTLRENKSLFAFLFLGFCSSSAHKFRLHKQTNMLSVVPNTPIVNIIAQHLFGSERMALWMQIWKHYSLSQLSVYLLLLTRPTSVIVCATWWIVRRLFFIIGVPYTLCRTITPAYLFIGWIRQINGVSSFYAQEPQCHKGEKSSRRTA